MTKESFESLLDDLYDVFNPTKKSEIPSILSKYNGREFDAVYHMIFKYNYPKSEHYNPSIGTPENVKFLIDEYSAGKKVVHSLLNKTPNSVVIIEEKLNSAQGAIEQQVNSVKQNVSDIYDKRQKDFDEMYARKMKELETFASEINNLKPASKSDDSIIDVRYNVLWTERDFVFPKGINNAPIGTRFLIYDTEGKILGIEIKDITIDCISDFEGYIKEITIDKV